MRMSYNGLLSQPSKLMTRVRLPSSALKKALLIGELFLCQNSLIYAILLSVLFFRGKIMVSLFDTVE